MLAQASNIHRLIKAIPSTNDFSNPATSTWLPFPSLLDIPARFTKSDRDGFPHFQYMGRSKFRELEERSKTNFLNSSERLCVYGTSGSGKSHILATYVCQLIREGNRVVYLPDCNCLLEDPTVAIWNALVFAFHDTMDLKTIRDPADMDALVTFMRLQKNLYVIVDQWNALQLQENDERAETKRNVRTWLDRMKRGNRYIYSASANEASNREAYMKQAGIAVFEVFGGMNEVETVQWFIHHKARIPDLSANERLVVEHLTGNIPLLLNGLIDVERFDEVKFMRSQELRKIDNDVDTFFRDKQEILKDAPESKSVSVEIVKACLQNQRVAVDDRRLYDLRYFYVDANHVAHYTCGVAFEAIMRRLRIMAEPFCQEEWYSTVRVSRNPVVRDFVAKDICLATIAKDGLTAVNRDLGRMSRTSFATKPHWDPFLHSEHVCCLFVPAAYNVRAVDGVILLLNRSDKIAHMFPIQITLSPRQRDSLEVFYTTTWWEWEAGLREAGFTVQSTFVYIDQKPPTTQIMPEVIKEVRSTTKVVSPEYSRVHVGVEQVDRRLAFALGILRW